MLRHSIVKGFKSRIHNSLDFARIKLFLSIKGIHTIGFLLNIGAIRND